MQISTKKHPIRIHLDIYSFTCILEAYKLAHQQLDSVPRQMRLRVLLGRDFSNEPGH